jgi:hypothetical protein
MVAAMELNLTPPPWSEWKAWIGDRRWLIPLARAEWAAEWGYHSLRRLALFDLLELAGRFAIVVAVVVWFWEADDRAKQHHYRAWELINAARGSTSDGGRKDALQDLNNDSVSLAGASLEKAYLPGINLRLANLTCTKLKWTMTYLEGALLQSADLRYTNLRDSNIVRANLQGAFLFSANLQRADLGGAVLQDANLQGADLRGALNLRQDQLNGAIGDDSTRLPEGLTRPAFWAKGGHQDPAPPQPDHLQRDPPWSCGSGSAAK